MNNDGPNSSSDNLNTSNDSVLGLDDLLRTRTQGFYTLHPRVQQLVRVGALDSLLEAVMNRLGLREKYAAYQYPYRLFECRGAAPDSTALHPPEYHIRTLETVREIRANNILTTVCRPGDSIPSQDSIQAALDSLAEQDTRPHAVFTLRLDTDGPSQFPVLIFHDDTVPDRCPTQEQLFDHMEYLCRQYGFGTELRCLSEYPSEVRDD